MATAYQERAPQRKKMATYGKAARRRIPEFSFAAMARKSLTPDRFEVPNELAKPQSNPTSRPTTPSKLKIAARRSPSRVQGPSISQSEDIYDVPDSDNDAPKKAPTPPPLKTKPKPMRQKQITRPVVSTSASTSNIWDVPNDDPIPKAVRARAATPPKLMPQARAPPSTSRRSASPQKTSVYDVPTSEDERPSLNSKRSHKTMQTQNQFTSRPSVPLEIANSFAEGRTKKLRLSPVSDASLKRLPHKSAVRPPRTQTVPKSDHSGNSSPSKVVQMVARPKIQALARKSEFIRSPQRLSPQPRRVQVAPKTPSASGSDVEMRDISPHPTNLHMSPRGVKILQNLLNSVEGSEEESSQSDHRSDKKVDPKTHLSSGAFGGVLSRPAGISKASQKSPRALIRRRLIDSLVEQTQEESDDDSDNSSESMSDFFPASQEPIQPLEVSESQLIPKVLSHPSAITSDSQGSQNGPRVTYTRVRSMLDEQDIMKDLQMGLPTQSASQSGRPRRVGAPGLKPPTNFHAEDEDDENTVSAIRSVHELRLAGANNRFLDDVQDFLERIGSPGKTPAAASVRRSGLLDLASKMKDKSFLKQFRDNGVEQRLFLHLGQETDIVSGFIVVSLLIAVLVEGNMPHIVAQLRRHGIARLIIRLLECQSSIVAIAKERKSNMSRIAQSLLAEHQDYLLKLPTWEELQPQTLSPRTLALKCLEIMVRQTREAGLTGDILSKELTTDLFAILGTASDVRCWDLPESKHAVDFYLALSTLESHSITARTLQDETIWISDYLPIIASALETAISKPIDDFGQIQVLLLRLTLNVTNNNPDASDVFMKSSLISIMARAIVVGFKKILRFLTEEELAVVLDHLILILGVMINFAEWSSTARELLQNLQGQEDDPLESIIQIFTENREKTFMADSMEENMKNVAFGYLSVLLGYLALLPSISKRVQNSQQRKTLSPLIICIEEFIQHHRTVDNEHDIDEDDRNPQAGLTERLESLVSKLNGLP